MQGAPSALRSARRWRTVAACTAALTAASHSSRLQNGPLAKTARQAIDALRRGVVAYSSVA